MSCKNFIVGVPQSQNTLEVSVHSNNPSLSYVRHPLNFSFDVNYRAEARMVVFVVSLELQFSQGVTSLFISTRRLQFTCVIFV